MIGTDLLEPEFPEEEDPKNNRRKTIYPVQFSITQLPAATMLSQTKPRFAGILTISHDGWRPHAFAQRIQNTEKSRGQILGGGFHMRIGEVLLMMTFATGAFAQTHDIEIPYQKFVLDNGLTLIVHEDHKAPIVAVNTWYHVGSKNERPGKTGFAHLFEHLMFGGSEHAPGRYIDAMETIGATDLNGTTNGDRTNYFENVPTSALDYTLWLESDRMGHLLGSLDQKTLDLQRGVVQNEKRQGENQPYGVTEELITKNTYPAGHPYSWTTIGEMADLDAASMSDVKDWFTNYYGAANVVLVLAGDIDPGTALKKAELYFGEVPSGPPVARFQTWIPRISGTRRQSVSDRVPLGRMYKVWNIPPY